MGEQNKTTTNVRVRTLVEYLESGRTLDDFLRDFPDVTRQRAVDFLQDAASGSTPEVDVIKKYDTVVSSGQAALRALMTLSGGATVAILTFIGHLAQNKLLTPKSTEAFGSALELFVYATLLAVLGYGTIFLTNTVSLELTRYRRKVGKPEPIGERDPSDWLFLATIGCGIASLVLFVMASQHAVTGFTLVGGGSPPR